MLHRRGSAQFSTGQRAGPESLQWGPWLGAFVVPLAGWKQWRFSALQNTAKRRAASWLYTATVLFCKDKYSSTNVWLAGTIPVTSVCPSALSEQWHLLAAAPWVSRWAPAALRQPSGSAPLADVFWPLPLQSPWNHPRFTLLWSNRYVVIGMCHCRAVLGLALVPRSFGVRSGGCGYCPGCW